MYLPSQTSSFREEAAKCADAGQMIQNQSDHNVGPHYEIYLQDQDPECECGTLQAPCNDKGRNLYRSPFLRTILDRRFGYLDLGKPWVRWLPVENAIKTNLHF